MPVFARACRADVLASLRRWRAVLLTAGAALLLSACASSPLPPNAAVQAEQAAPTLLLLGEVHDNPDGHRQRLQHLQQRLAAGWRPALVMEQFDREKQAVLRQAQASCADADCIIRQAGGTRWEWPHYRPLIALALRHDLPLVAANVSRADARRIVQDGFVAALDAPTRQRYRLDQPLPADLVAGQRPAIEAGHCGKMPAAMAPGMVNAQVARDIWMAKMLEENVATGAVLIAGNGHVRRDIGVVRWLPRALAASTEIHGYVEATAEEDPGVLAGRYDHAHLIPVHPRPDPCQGLALPGNSPSMPARE